MIALTSLLKTLREEGHVDPLQGSHSQKSSEKVELTHLIGHYGIQFD